MLQSKDMGKQYTGSVLAWRNQYERKLVAPDGWLSISGLYWLKEGPNRLGSDPSCDVEFPMGAAPIYVGIIDLTPRKITLNVDPQVKVMLGRGRDAKRVSVKEIKLSDYGSSEWFYIGRLKFAIIQRGVRYGVRVYDPNNPARRSFKHVNWSPIDESWRVKARFVSLDEPMVLSIVNVLGELTQEPSPGYVAFMLGGQNCKLYPLEISEGRLLFLFKDKSNQRLTYTDGRFLMAEAPQQNLVILDFNKAHNPPCAYTNFATCPLPPEVNRLDVFVDAGELDYVK
jgi:uncharacterized protein (DUF1684 family)